MMTLKRYEYPMPIFEGDEMQINFRELFDLCVEPDCERRSIAAVIYNRVTAMTTPNAADNDGRF